MRILTTVYHGHPALLNRILGYNLATNTLLLLNEKDVVLVDISLCTGEAETNDWLVEKRAVVSVIGYVERGFIRVSYIRSLCWMFPNFVKTSVLIRRISILH